MDDADRIMRDRAARAGALAGRVSPALNDPAAMKAACANAGATAIGAVRRCGAALPGGGKGRLPEPSPPPWLNCTAAPADFYLPIFSLRQPDRRSIPICERPAADSDGVSRTAPVEIFRLADRLADDARHTMFDPLPRVRRDIVLASRLFKHLLVHGLIIAPIDF
jgi:hypothetical protein